MKVTIVAVMDLECGAREVYYSDGMIITFYYCKELNAWVTIPED